MKWKTPRMYDKRIIKKFLIVPKEINNEVRWLELAEIEQEFFGHPGVWNDIRWVD